MSKGLSALENLKDSLTIDGEIFEHTEEYQIIKKELEALEILKPRIKLSDKTIKQAVFSDYNKITQEREEKEIVFVSASGFVFKNTEEHKLLKEWLENE